jgi:DNA-binding NtrC family response regulator
MVPFCAPPVQICFLPGILKLAPRFAGTMLLTRVEAMAVDQQIALFDWLSDVHPNVQVVSAATSRIDTVVREGRFLEDLFYRLNVVRVDASSARLPGYWRVNGSALAVHR